MTSASLGTPGTYTYLVSHRYTTLRVPKTGFVWIRLTTGFTTVRFIANVYVKVAKILGFVVELFVARITLIFVLLLMYKLHVSVHILPAVEGLRTYFT